MGRPKTYKTGQIISIPVQGLMYDCPPMPDIETIRGYDRPQEDQVWFRRTEFEQWDWNTDPKEGTVWWERKGNEEQSKWFDEEIMRLYKGDWIMINGVPTYFNNYCYFYHQWHTLQEGYQPIFKDVSLEYFRFYQLCEDDPMCVGDCGIKGRRVGLSSMSASITLLIGILEKNTIQGIVSKTGTDAQELFLFIKFSIENLPLFLMPELNKVTESEIHIDKKSVKNKLSSEKGKNNRIDYRDTSENAYDQSRKRRMIIDEAAKWVKVNVLIFLSKVLETVYVGASVVGHISFFSTVNKGDKGGDNFREVWDGSNHIDGKKDSFGRTKSRMKRFFIEGYRGFYGYIGKYGESIVERPTKQQTEYLKSVIDPSTGKPACPNPNIGAKDYLQEIRNMLGDDPELLAEEKRKYPFEWKEVFEGANNTCNFVLEDVNSQIERIESKLEGTGKKENGRRVSFKKRDSGEVYWEDDKKGMWYILQFPQVPNRSTIKWSIKCPSNTEYGAAGLDPIANARKTVDKGSDACCIIHSRFNALDPENSNKPVAMFLGRPKTKGDFHNQIFWALEYYGIKLLGEIQPSDWIDHATSPSIRLASPQDNDQKVGYLVTRKLSNGKDEYGIAPQNKEAREQHLTEMIEYSLNNIHKIEFLAILRNMIDFNIEDRTDYDACMAWGYALMALKEQVKQTVKPKTSGLRILRVVRKTA